MVKLINMGIKLVYRIVRLKGFKMRDLYTVEVKFGGLDHFDIFAVESNEKEAMALATRHANNYPSNTVRVKRWRNGINECIIAVFNVGEISLSISK